LYDADLDTNDTELKDLGIFQGNKRPTKFETSRLEKVLPKVLASCWSLLNGEKSHQKEYATYFGREFQRH